MNDFKINGCIKVTLESNMLTVRDSDKSFKLNGNLLKTMTIYKFNVGHSNLKDRKVIRVFAKEMKFGIKNKSRKSTRDRSIVEIA